SFHAYPIFFPLIKRPVGIKFSHPSGNRRSEKGTFYRSDHICLKGSITIVKDSVCLVKGLQDSKLAHFFSTGIYTARIEQKFIVGSALYQDKRDRCRIRVFVYDMI